jgi:hypothetical protein
MFPRILVAGRVKVKENYEQIINRQALRKRAPTGGARRLLRFIGPAVISAISCIWQHEALARLAGQPDSVLEAVSKPRSTGVSPVQSPQARRLCYVLKPLLSQEGQTVPTQPTIAAARTRDLAQRSL